MHFLRLCWLILATIMFQQRRLGDFIFICLIALSIPEFSNTIKSCQLMLENIHYKSHLKFVKTCQKNIPRISKKIFEIMHIVTKVRYAILFCKFQIKFQCILICLIVHIRLVQTLGRIWVGSWTIQYGLYPTLAQCRVEVFLTLGRVFLSWIGFWVKNHGSYWGHELLWVGLGFFFRAGRARFFFPERVGWPMIRFICTQNVKFIYFQMNFELNFYDNVLFRCIMDMHSFKLFRNP